MEGGSGWHQSQVGNEMDFFFFSSRRRHTRSLCDWSSDVCSSDLSSGFKIRLDKVVTILILWCWDEVEPSKRPLTNAPRVLWMSLQREWFQMQRKLHSLQCLTTKTPLPHCIVTRLIWLIGWVSFLPNGQSLLHPSIYLSQIWVLRL